MGVLVWWEMSEIRVCIAARFPSSSRAEAALPLRNRASRPSRAERRDSSKVQPGQQPPGVEPLDQPEARPQRRQGQGPAHRRGHRFSSQV